MKIKWIELALMPTFGAIMFVSKLIMEALPNVHLIAMFIVLFTIIFRWKALIAIYTFVFLTGVYGGFGLWWVPYLYIWAILWAVVMLLPKKMSYAVATVTYIVVCGLHGFLYGTLYAPFQALAYGLSFEGMITWIIAGFPFDVTHGISNLCVATLIMPVAVPLKREVDKLT